MKREINFTIWDWLFLVAIQLPWFILFFWLIHDFYFANSRLSKENPIVVKLFIFITALILIYIISNFFWFRKMVFVPSLRNLKNKVDVVESLESVFKWARYNNDVGNVYQFLYWGKFNKLSLKITIITEENGFLINVMDTGKCLLLDFGYYQYMTKKIKKAIEFQL